MVLQQVRRDEAFDRTAERHGDIMPVRMMLRFNDAA
jgi:hypothetical protein